MNLLPQVSEIKIELDHEGIDALLFLNAVNNCSFKKQKSSGALPRTPKNVSKPDQAFVNQSAPDLSTAVTTQVGLHMPSIFHLHRGFV